MHVWIGQEGFNFAEYEVYLDGVKQLYVFEVDEENGKLWRNVMENGEFKKIGMSEELVIECLRGKVELRRIDQQSQTRGPAQGPYSNYQMFAQNDGTVIREYTGILRANINGRWIDGYGNAEWEEKTPMSNTLSNLIELMKAQGIIS